MSDYDPINQSSQDEQRKQGETKAQLARKTEQDDIRWLMKSQRGRRIIWGFLQRAGVFRLSFNTNAMTMAFNEGTKNEGLRLLALVHTVCPDDYTTMTKEANA